MCTDNVQNKIRCFVSFFLYFISYLFLQFFILNTKWQLLHICCSLFIESKENIVQKNIKKMNLKINNKKGSLKKTHENIVLNLKKKKFKIFSICFISLNTKFYRSKFLNIFISLKITLIFSMLFCLSILLFLGSFDPLFCVECHQNPI